LVNVNDLNCISRTACEITWGGPDRAQAALLLRVLGSCVMLIDDMVVPRGNVARLGPGSKITFAFKAGGGELCIILSFFVHCTYPKVEIGAFNVPLGPPTRFIPVVPKAAKGQPPLPASVDELLPALELEHPSRPRQGIENEASAAPESKLLPNLTWQFECIFAAGLTPDFIFSLPTAVKNVAFQWQQGTPAKFLGRQHQPEIFETLLAQSPEFITYVSRNHFQLEPIIHVSDNCMASSKLNGCCVLHVTNLSQNVALIGQQPLQQGESMNMQDGDTLGFARVEKIDAKKVMSQPLRTPRQNSTLSSSQAFDEKRVVDGLDPDGFLVPFLTLRLVMPPLPPSLSHWVMMSVPPVITLEEVAEITDTPVKVWRGETKEGQTCSVDNSHNNCKSMQRPESSGIPVEVVVIDETANEGVVGMTDLDVTREPTDSMELPVMESGAVEVINIDDDPADMATDEEEHTFVVLPHKVELTSLDHPEITTVTADERAVCSEDVKVTSLSEDIQNLGLPSQGGVSKQARPPTLKRRLSVTRQRALVSDKCSAM